MKRINFNYISLIIVCALLSLTNISCQDDMLYDKNGKPIEGLPATINLKVDMSDMPELSRALIDEDGANYCESLWIGIYNEDGDCIFNNTYSSVSSTQESVDTHYTLSIETVSGRLRIVGVANVNSVDAFMMGESDTSTEQTQTLGTLLKAADTWEKFKKICTKRSEPEDIYQLTYDLTMSGYYSETDCDYYKTADEIPTVDVVEGTNNLPGTVNLRRLISYNQFNITADPNIDMKLESWQVVNNPYVSYVMENSTNAGDDYSNSATSVYNESLVSPTFTQSTTDGVTTYSFEFYQYENKHTACDYDGKSDYVGIRDDSGLTATDYYNDREREYKNKYSDANHTTAAANGDYHENLSIYKSLVDNTSDSESLKNNNAGYVILKAKLSYWIDANDIDNPDTALPVAETSTNKLKRTAEAIYVIHLGYCLGKDDSGQPTRATAMDFNCKRNSKYTYNIEILGAKNIVVEAYQTGGEVQPGAEGTVLDIDGDYIQMDSHYCVKNIELSNYERSSLKYHVTAPYGNTAYKFHSEEASASERATWAKNEFYNWIRIKPTESKDILAKYKESEDEDDSELWTLEDLCDVTGHPGNNGSKDLNETDPQYYTVFIDEYVYHKGETGNNLTGYDENTWKSYVNLDDRKVEIFAKKETSKDDESHYMHCKYAFSQKAIQTYYDGSIAGCTSGLGVEHTNESLYLNFRWFGGYNSDQVKIWSEENGRYNLYLSCHNETYIGNLWEKVVDQATPDEIAAGKSTSARHSHSAASYPVPQLYSHDHNGSIGAWEPSKDDKNLYYANIACMNRNRDLNGNGKIDKNEMRWYLPSYKQYAQIMIGLSGLVSPMIDWNEYARDYFLNPPVNDNSTSYREFLHYAASDSYYIWAEEGFSRGTSIYASQSSSGYCPYEIRCIRNLGTNPGADSDVAPSADSEVQKAFIQDTDNPNIIDAKYYTDICIRPYISSFLAPNRVNSEANRPYRRFKMSADYCRTYDDGYVYSTSGCPSAYTSISNDTSSDASKYSYSGQCPKIMEIWFKSTSINGVCRSYYEEEDESDKGTWRMPNIKEVAMMLNLEMCTAAITSNTYEYFVSYPLATEENYKYKFFGSRNKYVNRAAFHNVTNFGSILIRCVKDVK